MDRELNVFQNYFPHYYESYVYENKIEFAMASINMTIFMLMLNVQLSYHSGLSTGVPRQYLARQLDYPTFSNCII